MPNTEITEHLYARPRRHSSRSSVAGSLPILFFGDLFTARIATVGLNPSDKEYLDRQGSELDGPWRRFETLDSLGAAGRGELTESQCDQAIATMRAYYRPRKPVYAWFRSLDRVVRGLGFHYEDGEVSHLDLVQEATSPTWSGLDAAELADLRKADTPFLRWQLETFSLQVAVCNGRTVFDEVCRLVGAETVDSGRLARLTWYVAIAHGADRALGVVGWNIPLARPTGLDREGHGELGRLLNERLRASGPSNIVPER